MCQYWTQQKKKNIHTFIENSNETIYYNFPSRCFIFGSWDGGNDTCYNNTWRGGHRIDGDCNEGSVTVGCEDSESGQMEGQHQM